MTFETLAVIVLAGLGGPLLGASGRRFVPVVIGELLAGMVVGRTGLGVIDPTNPTVSFLGQVGFAMLMLSVGMHLPLRDPRLGSSLRVGVALAIFVVVLSVPGGLLAAAVAGTSHAAIYAVLLASGSAAVLLPSFEEADASGPNVLAVMAQVTIADILTILSVPIVLEPSRTSHAVLGGALVAAAVVLLLGSARLLSDREWVHRVRQLSKRRRWALDLRLSLLVLFFLAWIAQESGASILIAGFGAGVLVALIGGPKRLSTQMRGVAEGFFIPLYFVVLGAQLNLRGLFTHPAMLELMAALTVLNVAIHLAAAAVTRRPPSAGFAATAQLGVPAAIASLGLAEHVLSNTVATAVVGAALLSLLVCALGVESLVRHERKELPAATPSVPARL